MEGYANSLTRIELGDQDDGTLTVLANRFDGPTTFVLFASSAWAVEGQLAHFFFPGTSSRSSPFAWCACSSTRPWQGSDARRAVAHALTPPSIAISLPVT